MQPQFLDILSELAKSDTGMNELFHAKSRREIVLVLEKHGIDMTEQELDAYMEQFSSNDRELDETVLETVSGGNTSSAWRALGVIIPYFVKGRNEL